jgi:hypothetical protein
MVIDPGQQFQIQKILGAFFGAKRQKTGLSAPIPQNATRSCGISAQSLARLRIQTKNRSEFGITGSGY